MALKQEDLFKLDLYELLDLEAACSLQDVKKAFRKKALKCHPDKNPDNPNAPQLFHQLSCALEILSDSSARAAYDKILNGRKAAKLRNQLLDSRVKKLKEDLEERERNANNSSSTFNDEKKLQAEIERLRKEGSRLLQEEVSKIHEQVKKNTQNEEGKRGNYILTVRWKAHKNDTDNGGYSHSVLRKLLSKYGEILVLALSPCKNGSALVEFKTYDACISAAQYEKGLPRNPLRFEKLLGALKPPASAERSSAQSSLLGGNNLFPSFDSKSSSSRTNHTRQPSGGDSSHLSVEDLESAVLGRLRQKERMKRAAQDED